MNLSSTKSGALQRFFGGSSFALAIDRIPIAPRERRPIVKLQVDLPDLDCLGPSDVVVMLYMSQVCDTDYDMGTHDAHGEPTIGFDKKILFGHEGGGMVIGVGSKVTSVSPGDWVSVKVRSGGYGANCICCRAGQSERCLHWNGKRNAETEQEEAYDIRERGIFLDRGTMTPFLTLPEDGVIKAPKGVPARLTACGEPGGVLLAGFLRALELWWGDNDWMETTEEGPPAIAVIGAGSLSTLAAPAFTEMPGYFFDAIADGSLPQNFFCRPMAEMKRAQAGLPPKMLATPKTFYFARRATSANLFKARVPGALGVNYRGFEELGLEPITLDTGVKDRDGKPIMTSVYNNGALCDLAPKGKFDWVIELCGNSCQALLLTAPVDLEARFGGMAAPGTRITWTSITGGDESFPGLPTSKILWGATMNNIEISGIVNYPREATVLFFQALRRARARVPNWGDDIQEFVIQPDEILGRNKMYELKRQATGKIAVVMNTLEQIQDVCDALGVPYSTNE